MWWCWLGRKKLREELRQECLRKGTELAQAVADVLFALPPNEDRDGPIIHLPPPTFRLPREKHVRTSLNLLVLFAYMVALRRTCSQSHTHMEWAAVSPTAINLVPKFEPYLLQNMYSIR
jgi:hypothetical protein